MGRLLLLFSALLSFLSLIAQEKANTFSIVSHIDESQGAFSNTIYQVAFDDYGKCYIASDKGLGSYNGSTLKHINLQDGLHNLEVYNLKIRDSILYFLPLKGGLYYFNYLSEFPVFKRKAKVEDVLKDLVLKDSMVHLSTYSYIFSLSASNTINKQIYFNGSAYRVYEFEDNFYLRSDNSFIRFDINSNRRDTILQSRETIKSVCVYHDYLFYSSGSYFHTKNLKTGLSDSVSFSMFSQAALPEVIWPANDSVLFLAIDQRLIAFNRKTGRAEDLLDQVEVNAIRYNPQTDYYYVCTGNQGLYILKAESTRQERSLSFPKKISYLDVTEKPDYHVGFEGGEVWFNNQTFQSGHNINTMLSYHHILFLGIDRGICILNMSSKKTLYSNLNSTVKRAVACDSFVYFATSKAFRKISLNTFSTKTIIENNHRSYYLQKHSGILYTQSYNTDSLFRIDPNTDKISPIGHIKGQIVKSIEVGQAVYFITNVAHLYRYAQNRLTDIRIADHLFYPVSDLCYFELYRDHFVFGNNNFLVCSPVSDLEKGKYHFRPLYLPVPKNASYVQIRDNELYYALRSSIFHFPVDLNIRKKEFCGLRLKKGEVTSQQEHLLSQAQGRVSLDLEMISYSGKNPAITCYVIAGGKIVRIKKHILSNPVVLDSLPLGVSRILYFATDDHLNYSAIGSVPVFVDNNAFYRIVFTLICCSLGILLIAFLVFRYMLNHMKKQHALRMELILMEQKAGALLMNPHFVFNALGNIQGFIGNKQFEAANSYLLKFSMVIRSYLNFMKQGIVSLSKELESIHHFIEFQNIRHEGSLELHVTKAPGINTDQIHIPAFVLQPFVENSIKYFRKTKPILVIGIHISELNSHKYTITINDNGPGLTQDIHESIFTEKAPSSEFKSIAFTLQRLQKVHDANHLPFSYIIRNRYNGQLVEGLSVILHLSNLPHYHEPEG